MKIPPPDRVLAKTARLLIRPYRADDYEAWRASYLGQGRPRNRFDDNHKTEAELTRKAYLAWLRQKQKNWKTDTQYVFGVFDRETGENLGTIDVLVIMRRICQWANLGYQLRNQYWGKGYAKEAVAGVIELSFRKLRLHRLEAGTERLNKASQGVARSVGMRHEGLRRSFLFERNGWRDMEYFAITPEDIGLKAPAPSFRGER